MAKRSSRRSKKQSQSSLRIFISYSHRDREAVDLIVSRLQQDGHTPWIDQLQLAPGDNIAERIQDGLEQADAILFVMSRHSLQSEWVQREFAAIALQQISQQRQRIIPIRLDQCEVPSYFGMPPNSVPGAMRVLVG